VLAPLVTLICDMPLKGKILLHIRVLAMLNRRNRSDFERSPARADLAGDAGAEF